MPSQIFVTVNKDAARTPVKRLGCMCRTTIADEARHEDRFYVIYGDWFLIGGRWSGLLTDSSHDLLRYTGVRSWANSSSADLKIRHFRK